MGITSRLASGLLWLLTRSDRWNLGMEVDVKHSFSRYTHICIDGLWIFTSYHGVTTMEWVPSYITMFYGINVCQREVYSIVCR